MTGDDEFDGMPIGVSVPDALCGNVGDTVPLVRYDSAGRRTVIGVATVTGRTVNDDGTVSLTVDASTTARDLVEKGMPKAVPEFSLAVRPEPTYSGTSAAEIVRDMLERHSSPEPPPARCHPRPASATWVDPDGGAHVAWPDKWLA